MENINSSIYSSKPNQDKIDTVVSTVKLEKSSTSVNKVAPSVIKSIPLENTTLTTNKLIVISSQSSLEQVKGGELGFTYNPGAKSSLAHKIISFGQSISNKLKQEAGTELGDVDVVHTFIVVGKKDDHTLIVAEAYGKGMKESEIDIRQLNNDQFRLYQNSNELFRKTLVVYALQSVERKPNALTTNLEQLEHDLNKYNKSNGLYDRVLCLKVINRSIEWGKGSEKRMVNAATDLLMENPILNSSKKQKSQICSTFVALTYQATQFLQAIDSEKLNLIKDLKDRDAIITALHEEFKVCKDSANKFFLDHICTLDNKITPSLLEHHAKMMIS